MTLYTTFPVGNVNILLVSFLIIIIFNVTSTMETISKEKKNSTYFKILIMNA